MSTLGDISTAMTIQQGQLLITRSQDATPYLEANRRAFNDAEAVGFRKALNIREVADIPNIVVEKWLREGFNIFDPSPETAKELARRLNSRDWQGLRTSPGRVGAKV